MPEVDYPGEFPAWQRLKPQAMAGRFASFLFVQKGGPCGEHKNILMQQRVFKKCERPLTSWKSAA